VLLESIGADVYHVSVCIVLLMWFWPLGCISFIVRRTYDRACSMRMGVHDVLFRTTIEGQGDDEQRQAYLSDIDQFRMLGCFAMTELGHSSYLRGCETTATYDRDSDSFIVHSPTLTATKIWIGMAGSTATHTGVSHRSSSSSNSSNRTAQLF
jgi:alkylation response protein AidB-like acyl-CoA dehydrogenase